MQALQEQKTSLWVRIVLTVWIACSIGWIGCASGTIGNGDENDTVTHALVTCTASRIRFPTESVEAFAHAYAGRTFYADGNHLGYDIALPEGSAVHPIACGTVRIYRAANGYGTLVAVIEHRLPSPTTVVNGRGERVSVTTFLSIYGHLRTTRDAAGGSSLAIHVGDTVGPDDVIGYVQNDALNGDGAEHLHLGVRLQTMDDAMRTDRSWFRGYDGTPSQRQWFADPSEFLRTLMAGARALVRWHPAGSVLTTPSRSGEYWMVNVDDTLLPMDNARLHDEHLASHVISVDPEEIGCYRIGATFSSALSTHHPFVVHFLGGVRDPAVYEIDTVARTYRAFISHETFLSWGWRDTDIVSDLRSVSEVARTAGLVMEGMRLLRDGALVKGRGQSEVDVVSNGRRLPILDWPTFLALGYQETDIVEIDPTTLDAVAGPRGATITTELVTICREPDPCFGGGCDAGTRGGGGKGDDDASVDEDVGSTAPVVVLDAGVDAETDTGFDAGVMSIAPVDASTSRHEQCNGVDDDDNGQTDEIFPCALGRRGPTCVTACGANGYRLCEAPRCDWSSFCTPYPESCDNTIDDDCDGRVDCADTDCASAPACRPIPPVLDAGTIPIATMDAGTLQATDAGADVAESPRADVTALDVGTDRALMRYEFRVNELAGWSATEPYRLHNLWWDFARCVNTGTTLMQPVGGGWYRCDTPLRLSPFVGSFFSPPHTDWGDHGNLGTVGNSPEPCTPTDGVEWRITDLVSGRNLFTGASSGLPCVNIGTQSRHVLP